MADYFEIARKVKKEHILELYESFYKAIDEIIDKVSNIPEEDFNRLFKYCEDCFEIKIFEDNNRIIVNFGDDIPIGEYQIKWENLKSLDKTIKKYYPHIKTKHIWFIELLPKSITVFLEFENSKDKDFSNEMKSFSENFASFSHISYDSDGKNFKWIDEIEPEKGEDNRNSVKWDSEYYKDDFGDTEIKKAVGMAVWNLN